MEAALRLFNTPEIGAVNLLNNTARLLLAKPRNPQDSLLALGFFHSALCKYGAYRNYHHRAGVYYWISAIYEKLDDRKSAFFAANESLRLWEKQAELAPDNKSFKDKLEGAKKRLESLI